MNRHPGPTAKDFGFCLVALTTLFFMLIFFSTSCTRKSATENEVWIYTSLYKDTIADITPRIEKAFPDIKVQWFQAGSEEIATKVNGEIIAGEVKADLMISSDRFWYEELASKGKLLAYRPQGSDKVDATMKHAEGFYTTLSHPVMVIAYNKDSVKEPPKSFRELSQSKWKQKFSTGSALASGTNFSAVSVLQKKYGWDFFKELRKNDTISEGGNSAVLNRILSGERPVGAVLLENVLRLQGKDAHVGVVYPNDGVVMISNVMAIVKKSRDQTKTQKIADWMMGQEGQEAMTRSYMYSPLPGFPAPAGAPPLAEIQKKAFPWSQEFLSQVMSDREKMKEQYAQIMFE